MKKLVLILVVVLFGLQLSAQIEPGDMSATAKSQYQEVLEIKDSTWISEYINSLIDVTHSYFNTDETDSVAIAKADSLDNLLETGDITESADKNYVTDAEATVIGNTSGANTGDVPQAYYTMTFQTLTNSAAISDATTYYLVPNSTSLSTSATQKHQVCPVNSTLVGYTISIFNGTAGSSQETSTFYVRVNNTTDVTMNSSVTWSASGSTTTTFYGMGLDSDVDAGDTYNIKIVTPAWATNPQNFYMTVTLYFKTR